MSITNGLLFYRVLRRCSENLAKLAIEPLCLGRRMNVEGIRCRSPDDGIFENALFHEQVFLDGEKSVERSRLEYHYRCERD